MPKFRVSNLLLLLAIVLGAYLAFGPCLHGKLYGDDYMYRARDLADSPLWFFTHANPVHTYAYRPIEFALIWIAQELGSGDVFWIHLPQLLLHFAAAGLLFAASRSFGLGVPGSLLAATYFLVSQASVHAVCSNDTLSQILGTTLGWMSVWFFHRAVRGDRGLAAAPLVLAAALYVLALASKETSLGMAPLFGAVALLGIRERKGAWVRSAFALLPFVLLSVGYLGLRRQMGLPTGSWGDGTYDFHLGRNLLVNPVLFVIQSALPLSSAALFLAAKAKDWVLLGAAGLSVAGVIAIPLLGHMRSRRFRRLFLLGAGLVGSVCLSIPMNHVSELYAYSALPVFAIFFATGIEEMARSSGPNGRRAVLVFSVAVLLLNVQSSRAKSTLMAGLGERAAAIEPQIERAVDTLPPGRPLVLVETATTPTYSIFHQPGFAIVSEGSRVYSQVKHGRKLDVRFVAPTDPLARDTSLIRLRIDQGTRVVPFR